MKEEKEKELMLKIIILLKQEPRTAHELSHALGVHHYTTEKLLLKLALENQFVASKKVGRYEIWWWKTPLMEENNDGE